MPRQPRFEVAPSVETEARQREVQLLLNVAEPGPKYQAFILTDEASLLDATPTSHDVLRERLRACLGHDLDLDLSLPVWRLVDRIRHLLPGWPDSDEPN